MVRISSIVIVATVCALAVMLPAGAASPLPVQIQQPVNMSDCSSAKVNEARYLTIKKDTDPYTRVQWHFRAEELSLAAGQDVVLEVHFFDKGAGILLPTLNYDGTVMACAKQESYTRLNSGQERVAAFSFTILEGKENAPLDIYIAGLQYLKHIALVPAYSPEQWQALHEAVPKEVTPMVSLERPMDFVTTAGIASNKLDAELEGELAAMHNLVPLAKVLGFNAIEAYVRWRLIEPEQEGEFDFSYYDALVAKLQEHDMKWYPLLVVGSAYALPDWFIASDENVEMVCLEHGKSNLIQSIWSPTHKRHVTRVLNAFGAHYEPTNTLLGVRLGPSGNYGESQYPAGGNWASTKGKMHIHIGLWAGDDYARADFQQTMQEKYNNIDALNKVWDTAFASFDEIDMPLPNHMYSKRRRVDFMTWYTHEMSVWCEWWALAAREAMPNTPMYQCSGGWGFVEAGTSYSEQTKSMKLVDGGVRLTNETDSFEQDVYATRLACTAARLYDVDLGFEPASSHTARGVAGRIYNTTTTNGDHFFTYNNNVMYHQMAIDQWLKYYDTLDTRQDPIIDVAIYYPETMNQLDDAAFRHLYGWGFNPRAREVRRAVEVDYLDEILIRDGFLDRYKVLVFAWGNIIEADVQAKIDAWIQAGGIAVFPSFPRHGQVTVEGDATVHKKWLRGDTGKGRFYRYPGDMEPPSLYGDFVKELLLEMDHLHPLTQQVLRIDAPEMVFFSIQEDGHVLALNYNAESAIVTLPNGTIQSIPRYGIQRFTLE